MGTHRVRLGGFKNDKRTRGKNLLDGLTKGLLNRPRKIGKASMGRRADSVGVRRYRKRYTGIGRRLDMTGRGGMRFLFFLLSRFLWSMVWRLRRRVDWQTTATQSHWDLARPV